MEARPTEPGQDRFRPLVGLTAETKEIVPLKLKVLFRVIEIDAPEKPELKFTGPSVFIVKSPTWIVTEDW